MFLNHKNKDAKRRVALYVRVSTAEQKMDGYGIESQKQRLLEYVKHNQTLNWYTKDSWIYEDVHTGSELNRTNLNKLRIALKGKKFDAVLVWKIDRLSRSLKHLLILFDEFEKNEVSFISLQENIDFKGPIGRLIFQIFGAIAQFERELIKGRTLAGKIASAEMGNYTGTSIPYGYRAIPNPHGKGRRLEIVSHEKQWIQRMFEWYIYDGLGFGQIAGKLNEVKVPKGESTRARHQTNPWTERIVRNMLHSPVYRGQFVANRKDESGNLLPENEWTVVNIPACVSEFTFQQAQELSQHRVASRGRTEYLLSGKIRDISVTPPRTFVGCQRKKGGFSYRRKQFRDKYGNYHMVVETPGKQLDDYIWGRILEAFKNPELFIEKYVAQHYRDPKQVDKLEQELNSLRERQLNIGIEIARIEDAYEKGVYSEEKMVQKIASKNDEQTAIEEKIGEIQDQLRLLGSLEIEVAKLQQVSKQLKYRLEKLNQEQKKILVRLFIDRVEINRTEIETSKQNSGKKKQWRMNVQTFFRFNPEKFPSRIVEVRTGKDGCEGENESFPSQNEADGRGCRGGYHLFHLHAEIKKRRVVINHKGRNRCVEQVYVEERVDADP